MYWLIALILVVVLSFIGYSKWQERQTDEIDGGVTHYEDTDAPKTIESNQMESFFCKFSTMDLAVDDSPLAGQVFTLKATKDGGSMELRNDIEGYENRTFTPTSDFFTQLQQIVEEYDFAQYNGQFYSVSGLPPDFGIKLEIWYVSGENIQASNNQDCFLPLKAMEALVELFQSA